MDFLFNLWVVVSPFLGLLCFFVGSFFLLKYFRGEKRTDPGFKKYRIIGPSLMIIGLIINLGMLAYVRSV